MADSKNKKNDKPAVKKPNRIQKWWRETVGELRKVTWPSKEDAIKMTKVTAVVVIVDFVFSELISLIIG